MPSVEARPAHPWWDRPYWDGIGVLPSPACDLPVQWRVDDYAYCPEYDDGAKIAGQAQAGIVEVTNPMHLAGWPTEEGELLLGWTVAWREAIVGEKPPRRGYPESFHDLARSLYRPRTFGYAKVAKALGVSEQTIRNWLGAPGSRPPSPRTADQAPRTPEPVEQWARASASTEPPERRFVQFEMTQDGYVLHKRGGLEFLPTDS